MRKYCFFTVLLLIALVLSIYSVDLYFLARLGNQLNAKSTYDFIQEIEIEENLSGHQVRLKSFYRNQNPKYFRIKEHLVRSFTPCPRNKSFSLIWREVDAWSKNTTNEIYPAFSPLMCQLLSALKEAPITAASNARRGTQLKLNLTLEDNKMVYFKPAWYTRERIMKGEVYAGKDRHNSEVLAFYLGAVLNLRWTSIAVGRSVNVKVIYELADKELQETVVRKSFGTKLCVYGKCYYCNPKEYVCGNKTHFLEGVLLYEVPGSIQKHKSPWQRTYKDDQKAQWETDDGYCQLVKKKLSPTRLLDLIDASIFDFLILNGDRHHYETRKNRLLLLDNGKGFGTTHNDFADIAAPLYQCCILRKTTYARLLLFTGGSLSDILKEMTRHDALHPVITDDHFRAMERRLLKIFSMIEFCRSKYGNSIFQ